MMLQRSVLATRGASGWLAILPDIASDRLRAVSPLMFESAILTDCVISALLSMNALADTEADV